MAAPPPAPHEQKVLLGIGFMLLAASILPVMNGVVQWLSLRYPSEQIVWARVAGHLVVMLLLTLPRSGVQAFATRKPLLQLGRSVCQLSSTVLYFTALVSLPLAKAAAIGFIGPFLVALLAWPMLGEKLRLPRMMAVLAAFVGVVVVMRPGGEAFQPASLLILASTVFHALYQVLTRMVAPYDRADTCVLWSALLGGVLLSMLVPFFWVTPTSLLDALAFLSLGVMGAGGHYFVVRAFSNGPAAVISPFHYWQIVGAVLIGVALTGLWPDAATWAGAAIVITAGVFLAVNEGRRR